MNFLTETMPLLNKVRKSFINSNADNNVPDMPLRARDRNNNPRGSMIYNNQQLAGVSGLDKWGNFQSGGVEYPLFRLTISQRVEFVKLCAPLHGLIASRMKEISTTDYKIVPIRNEEDREYSRFRALYQLVDEYKAIPTLEGLTNPDLIKYIILREHSKKELASALPDLLPDASNFSTALLRWKQRLQNTHLDMGEKIKNWLETPNGNMFFSDYRKKVIFDLMVHGTCATYKKITDGKLSSFDVLPGGSVFRIKEKYFSGLTAYIQIVMGLENQFFYPDEIMYIDDLPTSNQSYPLIPIESVLNKLIPYLLTDQEIAQQADGTRPPEKILAVAKKTSTPFDGYDAAPNLKMSPEDANRLEMKINEPRRYPIIVLDSLNGDTMEVIDIGKENLYQLLEERQDKISKDIAIVYSAMPYEMGLTGTEFTNGREGSDNQRDISHGRGMQPLMSIIEKAITRDLIPYRFGFGYKIEFEKSKNDIEERTLDAMKLKNGEITINELRYSKGQTGFGPEYDKPIDAGTMKGDGTSELSPLFTKTIK